MSVNEFIPPHHAPEYLKPIAAVVVALGACWLMLRSDSIERPPGEIAPNTPIQTAVEHAEKFAVKNFFVEPRAHYDIEARVLSVERYHVDTGASIAPIDFAVGWGPMSDSDTLRHFRVTQGSRFFTIYPDQNALDIPTALLSSANMHLIPADDNVRKILFSTHPGHIVHMQGFLVGVTRADGFTWNSSLTRTDTGDGACELMYVQSIERR